MLLTLQDVLAAGALVVALLALPSAWLASRTARRGDGTEAFLAHLRSLRETQVSLTARVLDESPQNWRVGGMPMLARVDWIPSVPFDVGDLVVSRRDDGEGHEVESMRRVSARVLSSLRLAPIRRYSDALVQIAGMSELFDGTVYRLLDVDIGGDAKRMTFSRSTYFPILTPVRSWPSKQSGVVPQVSGRMVEALSDEDLEIRSTCEIESRASESTRSLCGLTAIGLGSFCITGIRSVWSTMRVSWA